MEYILIPSIAGIIYGILVGSLPGFGVLASLLMILPLIDQMDSLQLLIFYGTLMCVVQYIGSVVAIYFGIPGENTSLIASRIGHQLARRKPCLINDLLAGTAIGSFVASLFALAILSAIMVTAANMAFMASLVIQLFLLLLVLLILLRYQSQGLLVNLWLIVFGFFLGCIGYNPIPWFNITFGQDWLLPGANYFLVIMMLFILPNFYVFWQSNSQQQTHINSTISKPVRLQALLGRLSSIIRGSILGSISGLIPGIGTSISSQFAHDVEDRLKAKPLQRLLSAESSNNAAVITCLLPLVTLGIPILASEALILDLITFKGTNLGATWFSGVSPIGYTNMSVLLWCILMINIIAFFMSWKLAPILARLYQMISPQIMILIICSILAVLLVYNSFSAMTYLTDVIISLALLPMMFCIIKWKLDSLPLIFAFMLSGQLQAVMMTSFGFLNSL